VNTDLYLGIIHTITFTKLAYSRMGIWQVMKNSPPRQVRG